MAKKSSQVITVSWCCKTCFNSTLLPAIYSHQETDSHTQTVVSAKWWQMVESLHYKLKGHRFDSQWCHWFFIDLFFSVTPWPWGQLSQNRNECQSYLLGGEEGKGSQCRVLTTLPPSRVYCLEILGASMSWRTKGLSRPLIGLLYPAVPPFQHNWHQNLWKTPLLSPAYIARETITRQYVFSSPHTAPEINSLICHSTANRH
jgi:hypothetical protein